MRAGNFPTRDAGGAGKMPAIMITLSHLSLRRGTRELLRDVNLTLHAGEHIGLIGANGCGKTSLLLLLRGEISMKVGKDGVAWYQLK